MFLGSSSFLGFPVYCSVCIFLTIPFLWGPISWSVEFHINKQTETQPLFYRSIDSTLLWVPTGFLIILCKTRVQFFFTTFLLMVNHILWVQTPYILLASSSFLWVPVYCSVCIFLTIPFLWGPISWSFEFHINKQTETQPLFYRSDLLLIVHFYESQFF